MRRPRSPLLLVVVTLAALALGACEKADSILLVEVYGSVDLRPSQFRVTITAGLDTRALLVPPNLGEAGLISLPASFTIAVDQGHMAPVTISIDALDETGSTIAFGTTTVDHVVIGGQTIIAVPLTKRTEPTGADSGSDAGGGGPGDAPADGDAADAGATDAALD